MGLNFYLESYPPCPTCGHVAERLHLGKSSAGWAFLFRAYSEFDLMCWDDWFNKIMAGSYLIKDEEDRVILLKDFAYMIKKKKKGKRMSDIESGYQEYLDKDGYRFDKEEFG